MDADQRIAEWLTEDARFDEDSSEPEAAVDRSTEPSSQAPEPPPVAVQRVKRIPAAFGFSGPEARILELVDAIGRRIRREPLPALAIAAAAGFVLGGAMSFRAGRLLVAAGVRRFARDLLKQIL